MKRIAILFYALLFLTLGYAQNMLYVEVQLSKPKGGGELMAALCPDAEAFKTEKGCVLKAVKAEGKVVVLTFENVRPGTYALKLYHDMDGDGKLGTNKLGIPNEPFGFSNDAMGTFGPPSFEQAGFEVGKGVTTINVKLKG